MSESIERFEIHVPDEVLDDLRERLVRTRYPDQLPGSGWDYGTDTAYLRELCEYWRDGFDWRAQEARLNRFEHYRTRIDGQTIHFVHRRSPLEGALPIVLSHGWPGSVAEFDGLIEPLADPASHGGDAADAFHVVCPSLPGYGWSGPTGERGWDARRIARAFAALMERLGYDRYGAQGGDWGAMITTQLGLLDAAHVCGIHLNMVIAGPPDGADPMDGVTPDEAALLGDLAEFQKNETGYQQIQGTKPQTLGVGLNDSPAGLAAWIVEKFRTWSDCDGDVERRFTKDQLLTNITIYWATGTINSSMRLYYETMKAGRFGLQDEAVKVPTGAVIFPKEIIKPPRRWAESRYHIVHWTRMERGGHFAALEEPAALAADMRAFFRKVR